MSNIVHWAEDLDVPMRYVIEKESKDCFCKDGWTRSWGRPFKWHKGMPVWSGKLCCRPEFGGRVLLRTRKYYRVEDFDMERMAPKEGLYDRQ